MIKNSDFGPLFSALRTPTKSASAKDASSPEKTAQNGQSGQVSPSINGLSTPDLLDQLFNNPTKYCMHLMNAYREGDKTVTDFDLFFQRFVQLLEKGDHAMLEKFSFAVRIGLTPYNNLFEDVADGEQFRKAASNLLASYRDIAAEQAKIFRKADMAAVKKCGSANTPETQTAADSMPFKQSLFPDRPRSRSKRNRAA